MRKALLTLLGLGVLAAPAAVLAASGALGDGTLSIDDGRGTVTVQARGAVLGRLEQGSITVADRSPDDLSQPIVYGWDERVLRLDDTVVYVGDKMRFRVLGGSWRIVVRGIGIDLSAVGRGTVRLKGEGLDPGVYSTDGEDCRVNHDACLPIPTDPLSFPLVTPKVPSGTKP